MKLKGGVEFILSRAKALSLSLDWVRKSIIRSILVLLIFGAFFAISSFVPQPEKVHAAGNTYYVNVATGNDTTGDGSLGNPWQHMIKAETAAATGDTVYVETGIYVEPSAVGGSTGFMSSNKGITWIARNGTATVRAASSTAAFSVGSTNIASWNGFIFDGESNTRSYGILISNAENKTFTNCTIQYASVVIRLYQNNLNIVFTGCTLTGTTNGLVTVDNAGATFNSCTFNATSSEFMHSAATNTRDVVINGGTFNFGGTLASLAINWPSGGNLTINGAVFNLEGSLSYLLRSSGSTKTGKITFTNNNISGGVNITSALIAITYRNDTAEVSGNIINLTNVAIVGGTLISIADNLTPKVENNIIDILSPTGPIAISIASSATGPAVNVGAAIVKGNTVRSRSKTGVMISVGEESLTTGLDRTGMLDGSIIENNTLYGPLYFDPAATGVTQHGVLLGHNKGYVRNNYVNGSHYGLVIKGNGYDWSNTVGIYNNVIVNCNMTSIYLKGVINVPVVNNTMYLANNLNIDVSSWNGMLYVGTNADFNNSSTGATIQNNILVARETLDLVRVDTNAVTGFNADRNVYWVNSGANPKFIWDSVTNTSLTDWQTSSGEGNSSAFTNPIFQDISSLSLPVLRLLSTSPAIDAGTSTGTPATDYAGNARRDNFLVANTGGGALSYYDIGAYEYVAPLSIVPSAPTLSAISTSSINIVINANGNVDTTEYAIENTTTGQWVQADGTLGASEVWQNRAAWGGDLGIANTGLSANTTYTYKVKARNAEHIETALSDLSGHYTLSDIPVLSSLACPSQTTYCLDTTPDITVTNTSPDASYYYLVNQILNPDIATVKAGTADADGTFIVPDGQIHPHATFYIHVIAQNPDGNFSTNYGTYKIISRDSSGSVEPVTTTPESTPVATSTIPTTEEIINEIVNTSHDYFVSPPVASFVMPFASFSPTADNLAGGTISFDATGSTSNKEIVKYEWAFGDGTTSSSVKTDHKYTAPGRYTVTLTVTDSAGNKNTTTQTIDVKPIVPTITNITANGTALWIEGKADPNTTIYFTIHSNPFEGQGLANKDGYWTYYLDNTSEVLGEGDHTIVALAAVKLADNTELKGVESKTYDFKMNVDNGKLNVETQKTRVWQIATGIIGSLFILLIAFLVFRRRRI